MFYKIIEWDRTMDKIMLTCASIFSMSDCSVSQLYRTELLHREIVAQT